MFLWIKLHETTYFYRGKSEQQTTSKGKTWSHGATSPLPYFAVNLTLNLSIIKVIKFSHLRFLFFKKNPTLAYLILSE